MTALLGKTRYQEARNNVPDQGAVGLCISLLEIFTSGFTSSSTHPSAPFYILGLVLEYCISPHSNWTFRRRSLMVTPGPIIEKITLDQSKVWAESLSDSEVGVLKGIK